MADDVKVIVKDNQEIVSLFIGTNTGQWIDVAGGIEYTAGNVTINGHFEVDGDVYIADEMQVDGGIRSTYYNKIGGLPTEYLMADGSVTTGGTPWVDVAGGIEYTAGNVTIGRDIQVDGDSTFQEVSTTTLSCDGLDASGVANLDGGARITIDNEYTDNADAIAGGLSIGDVYRTGDLMKIVH